MAGAVVAGDARSVESEDHRQSVEAHIQVGLVEGSAEEGRIACRHPVPGTDLRGAYDAICGALDGKTIMKRSISFALVLVAALASGASAQARAQGDLDGDFHNDHADFVLFKATYESLNGTGSFTDMLAAVPEPAAILLSLFGGFIVAGQTGRRRCNSLR